MGGLLPRHKPRMTCRSLSRNKRKPSNAIDVCRLSRSTRQPYKAACPSWVRCHRALLFAFQPVCMLSARLATSKTLHSTRLRPATETTETPGLSHLTRPVHSDKATRPTSRYGRAVLVWHGMFAVFARSPARYKLSLVLGRATQTVACGERDKPRQLEKTCIVSSSQYLQSHKPCMESTRTHKNPTSPTITNHFHSPPNSAFPKASIQHRWQRLDQNQRRGETENSPNCMSHHTSSLTFRHKTTISTSKPPYSVYFSTPQSPPSPPPTCHPLPTKSPRAPRAPRAKKNPHHTASAFAYPPCTPPCFSPVPQPYFSPTPADQGPGFWSRQCHDIRLVSSRCSALQTIYLDRAMRVEAGAKR